MAGPGMIDLNNKGAWQNLAEIAKFAIGSKEASGDDRVEFKGGAGRIGMIGGRVVKFNTHASERRNGPKADQTMRNSCNELRKNLFVLAKNLNLNDTTLASIRTKLGLNANGQAPASAKLLDRKVVVSVINLIGKGKGYDVWAEMNLSLNEIKDDLASTKRDAVTGKKREIDTNFATVAGSAAALQSESFLADNGAAVRKLAREIAEGMIRPDKNGLIRPDAKRKLPEETVTVIDSILRRSVEAVIIEKNDVSIDLLKGPGSTYEAMAKLLGNPERGELNGLTMSFAILAQSLPPREANAFLRALLLVPVGALYGLTARLHAVAAELTRLSEEKFTLDNIMRLVLPDLSISKGNEGEKMTAETLEPILEGINNWCDAQTPVRPVTEDGLKDVGYATKTLSKFMAAGGMSWKDLKTCLRHPGRFSLKMLPTAAFLPTVETPFFGEEAFDTFVENVRRDKLRLKIFGSNEQDVYEMPESFRSDIQAPDPNEVGALRKNLGNLCGNENKAQLAHVLLAMGSILAAEYTVGAFIGAGVEGHLNLSFTLRKDETTGDVVMTRRARPDMDAGLLTVVRFSPDGTMKLESARIQPGKEGEQQ